MAKQLVCMRNAACGCCKAAADGAIRLLFLGIWHCFECQHVFSNFRCVERHEASRDSALPSWPVPELQNRPRAVLLFCWSSDQAKVDALMKSIMEIGLQEPVSARALQALAGRVHAAVHS